MSKARRATKVQGLRDRFRLVTTEGEADQDDGKDDPQQQAHRNFL